MTSVLELGELYDLLSRLEAYTKLTEVVALNWRYEMY
jgi:hypothetical protein